MPKKRRELYKAFVQHGVVLEDGPGEQMIGDCPFCGKEGKFYSHRYEGMWDCKRCGLAGGVKQFLERMATQNKKQFQGKCVLKLVDSRRIAPRTFRRWNIGWDGNRQYTIPVDAFGSLTDLRRFDLRDKKTRATVGSHVSLVGRYSKKSKIVWVLEGEWDGMAFDEAIYVRRRDRESVVAVVGAMSFPPNCVDFFEGKDVKLVFDNDGPGVGGMVRTGDLLSGIARSVEYVHWPVSLPDGFDFRDLFLQSPKSCVEKVEEFLKPEPPVDSSSGGEEEVDDDSKPSGRGLDRGKVVKGFRKFLLLPDDEVLSVLFGAIIANRMQGDPVWLFLVAPPGGAKSELLMSFTDAPLITTTTTLTPRALISGANFAGGDPSLIPKLNNRVLIIKDLTAILELPQNQRDEIFGMFRDAYDGRISKEFGNGVHRVYESRFGIVAGVTPSIDVYAKQHGMLGERFLRYLPQVTGFAASERELCLRAISHVGRDDALRNDLRECVTQALNFDIGSMRLPVVSHKNAIVIMNIAQWVAAGRGVVMREKYTGQVIAAPVKEVATRLSKQLTKLAIGVALFHRTKIDNDVLRVVTSVARSTIPGVVNNLIKWLFILQGKGKGDAIPVKILAAHSRVPEGTVRINLEDMEMLKIAKKETEGGYGRWSLTQSMYRLMKNLDVYGREIQWLRTKRAQKNGMSLKPIKKKKKKRLRSRTK